MSPPAPTLSLPPNLEAKLAAFRRRVWIVKLAEGLLAAAFGLALSYLVVFILDRFMETPAWLRGLLMLAGALTLGLGLPLKWHRWVWQQRRLEDAARLLRRSFPRLGDQLLGIVELTKAEHAHGRSERLVQAAMAQADAAVKDMSFDDAVPQARHHRWAWIAGSVGALAAVAFAFVPAAAWNATARWITPWRDIERYTFAKIEPVPQRMVVPYAEPVDLNAKLRTDTEWSPTSGTARVGSQPQLQAANTDAAYAFKLPPQKLDAPVKLSIGDVRKTIDLVPTQRPELKALSAQLILPDYLQYTSKPIIEARSGAVSVLKGASVQFDLTATRALAAGQMDGKDQPIVVGKLHTAAQAVTESREHSFTWTDADGLAAREPLKIKANAVDDEQPRVLARRESNEQVILDTEVVSLNLEATDDFGIKATGLEWKGIESDIKGQSVSSAGAPEQRTVNATGTFSPQRDGVPPGSIELRAWVTDYHAEHRSVSPAIQLHIMTKDDHALWMTDQFGKWLQAARETYEQEQRLHETNKELRALPPEQLDRPENRRKVQQQATAEMANRERLDRLNNAGKQMVEQAARNDAFEAKKLEQWAQTLKQLKDIATKRMPTVADMLKKSSSAESKAQAAAQQPKDPSTKSTGSTESEKSDKKSDSEKGATAQSSPPSPPQPPGDKEKSHFANKPQDGPQKPSPPTPPKLGLPGTTLGSPDQEQKKQAASPAQEGLDKAIDEQKKLLDSFAAATDQMKELLASLEGSTFVKRLKAASRKQIGIASTLSTGTLSSFGLDKRSVPETATRAATDIATTQTDASKAVHVIQSDLDAYYQRKQDLRFKNILEQMKKTEVVSALARIGDEAKVNFSGRSIAASEYWADQLDRWAEELVAAAQAGDAKEGKSAPQDSLPPEIVLKVMQVLFDQMKLRDETREAEAAKPAIEKREHIKRSMGLALKQDDIGRRTYEAAAEISKLPKAKSFNKELKLLTKVTDVMKDAYAYLDKADTGPPAVAAETEAIELLLEARRQPPGGGGGGGGGNEPGGGGGAQTASQSALADIGPGGDATATITERETGQSTGKAGREFPEEFKTGLDGYFNALEARK